MPELSLDTTHGLKGVIVSLLVAMAVYLIKDIVRGIWIFVHRNWGPSRNEFIELTKEIHSNSELLLQQKKDIRRIYLFLKVISGDKWKVFRKQVEEIEKEIIS